MQGEDGLDEAGDAVGRAPEPAEEPPGFEGGHGLFDECAWALAPNPEHGLCGLCQRSWCAVEGVLEGDR